MALGERVRAMSGPTSALRWSWEVSPWMLCAVPRGVVEREGGSGGEGDGNGAFLVAQQVVGEREFIAKRTVVCRAVITDADD